MAEEKKTFDLLGLTVEITLTDTVPEGFREGALGGVWGDIEDETIKVWFKGLVTHDHIVHEAWHVFSLAMSYLDNQHHYWQELYTEIYAYEFQGVCHKLLDLTTSMDLYKKLYDKSKKGAK